MTVSLKEMAEQSKKPLNVVKEYDIDETAEQLVQEWGIELGKHGQTPKPHENKFAYNTFKLWQEKGVLDLPVIIGAEPGFGKSVMISVFLRYMTRTFPDTFGAIIVKERIEDMKRLASEINDDDAGEGLLRQNKYAYYIQGFDSEEMTREHYEEQFTVQAQYNVVIMTTKQFEMQALKDNLGAFRRFKDSQGSNRPRRLLLVDEKPNLVISRQLSYGQLNEIKENVLLASHKVTGKRQPYVNKVIGLINCLSTILEETDHTGRFRLSPIKPEYMLPRRLLAHYGETFGVEELQTLRAFERAIGYGGEISAFNGHINVISTFYLHYEITEFNTFIMDGTGNLDPEYIGRDFNLYLPEKRPDYSNVTFHVCDQYSMSKSSIASQPDAIENIAKECKNIIDDLDQETLVVSNKQFTDDLQTELAGEQNAVFKHYDGGRGTNQFAHINNAIFIGVLHKGQAYYSTAAQAVVGDRNGEELDIEQEKKQGRFQFNEPRIEEFKKLDIAVNMVQETNRIRANKKDDPVHIYVFYNNKETIKHITDEYEGAKIVEYKTIDKLVGKKTRADQIIDYFKSMQHGEVKQSHIYQQLDMHRNTFSKELNNERVQEAMNRYGIRKEKTRFIKD